MLCAYPFVRKDAAKLRKKNDICKFSGKNVANICQFWLKGTKKSHRQDVDGW